VSTIAIKLEDQVSTSHKVRRPGVNDSHKVSEYPS